MENSVSTTAKFNSDVALRQLNTGPNRHEADWINSLRLFGLLHFQVIEN